MNSEHKAFLVRECTTLIDEGKVKSAEDYCEKYWPEEYPLIWKPPKGHAIKRFFDWKKIENEPNKKRRHVYGTEFILQLNEGWEEYEKSGGCWSRKKWIEKTYHGEVNYNSMKRYFWSKKPQRSEDQPDLNAKIQIPIILTHNEPQTVTVGVTVTEEDSLDLISPTLVDESIEEGELLSAPSCPTVPYQSWSIQRINDHMVATKKDGYLTFEVCLLICYLRFLIRFL